MPGMTVCQQYHMMKSLKKKCRSSPKRMRSESDDETSTVSNSSLTKRAMMKTTLAYLMNREMNYIDINYRY